MRIPQLALIGLGSNLASPRRQILEALSEIAAAPGVELLACSSLYRTAPVGYADQPDFINAVAKLRTTLAPMQLLQAMQSIESSHGRERELANGPRTLDLDILMYGNLVQADPALTLPHPRMHERAFVLLPLLEIAPECVIPGHGQAADCLQGCLDQPVFRLPDGVRAASRPGSRAGSAS